MRWLQRFWTAVGVTSLAFLVVTGLAPQRRAAEGPRESTADERERTLWRLARGPLLIWVVLLVVLGGSAWSAFFPLGALNPTINLLLAALMLFILATFLMDLKSASPVVRLVASAGVLWVVFLFTLTFTDYLSRRQSLPIEQSRLTLPHAPSNRAGFGNSESTPRSPP